MKINVYKNKNITKNIISFLILHCFKQQQKLIAKQQKLIAKQQASELGGIKCI